MRLIPESGKWYLMASNWVYIAIAILTLVESEWVPIFSPVLPESWYAPIVAILALLGVVARLIDQGIKP